MADNALGISSLKDRISCSVYSLNLFYYQGIFNAVLKWSLLYLCRNWPRMDEFTQLLIRRIDGYLPVRCAQTGDGETVRYRYWSHKTEKVEEERVDVYTFIGRMIQHTYFRKACKQALPKGFKRIRYYGMQATKTFERVKVVVQETFGEESNGRYIRSSTKGVQLPLFSMWNWAFGQWSNHWLQESGWSNLTRNIMKGICQRSDVRGVITIPRSVLSKSPPRALSSKTQRAG